MYPPFVWYPEHCISITHRDIFSRLEIQRIKCNTIGGIVKTHKQENSIALFFLPLQPVVEFEEVLLTFVITPK